MPRLSEALEVDWYFRGVESHSPSSKQHKSFRKTRKLQEWPFLFQLSLQGRPCTRSAPRSTNAAERRIIHPHPALLHKSMQDCWMLRLEHQSFSNHSCYNDVLLEARISPITSIISCATQQTRPENAIQSTEFAIRGVLGGQIRDSESSWFDCFCWIIAKLYHRGFDIFLVRCEWYRFESCAGKPSSPFALAYAKK